MSKDLSSNKRVQLSARVYPHVMTITVLLATALIFVIGQVLGIFLFTVILSLAGNSTQEITDLFNSSSVVKFLAIFLVELVSISFVVGLLRYFNKKPLEFLKLHKAPNKDVLIQVAKTYGLYFLTFIAVAIIGDVLIDGLDVDQQQQLGYDYSFTGLDYFWVFLTLVILPPIAEEILFRGFLYRILGSVTSKRIAVIATSVLFAVAHLEFFSGASLNWIAAVDTFILSLFLIRLYEKTGNLWASILLHGLKNSIAFTALFII